MEVSGEVSQIVSTPVTKWVWRPEPDGSSGVTLQAEDGSVLQTEDGQDIEVD